MREFFRGVHFQEASDSATEEQIVVNYARVTVIKYAATLSKAFRIVVPEEAETDLRKSAQRRETYLLSMVKELQKAQRKAELNACKCGFGVIQAVFVRHAKEPEVRELDIQGLKQTIHEYTMVNGQSRSYFQFRSIPPEQFFPVFTDYDDPNLSLYYVVRLEEGRLEAEVRERYKDMQYDTVLDVTDVEPTVNLLHYWDKEDYYLICEAKTKPRARKGRTQEDPGSTIYAVLEHTKHTWGRPPFWIMENVNFDDADPTWLGTASDQDAIKELNRRYNETLSDLATEIRTKIHKPLVYSSDDHLQDLDAISYEPDKVIPIGIDEKLETLRDTDSQTQVTDLLSTYRESIHNQAFLNEASFGNVESGMSGVGVRLAQASMEQLLALKVPLRIEALEHMLSSILAYTHQLLKPVDESAGRILFRQNLKGKQFNVVDLRAEDFADDYSVEVTFPTVLPADQIQHEQNEVYKFKSKVKSLRDTLLALGVQDADSAIARIKEDQEDPVLNPEMAMLIAQAKQANKGQQGPSQQTMTPEPLPNAPRSAAPTVPSTAATPNGANVPSMERPLESAGANLGSDMGFPPGPGINTGMGGL